MTTAAPVESVSAPITVRPRNNLVPLMFIQLLAGLDEDGALAMVTTGPIEFAWDIASKGSKARTIRILYSDALACAVDRPCFAGTFTDALAFFLPNPSRERGRDTLLASVLRRRMCCSWQLLNTHVRSKELNVAFPARRETGPTSSPCLSYPSVLDFFKRRLIRD